MGTSASSRASTKSMMRELLTASKDNVAPALTERNLGFPIVPSNIYRGRTNVTQIVLDEETPADGGDGDGAGDEHDADLSPAGSDDAEERVAASASSSRLESPASHKRRVASGQIDVTSPDDIRRQFLDWESDYFRTRELQRRSWLRMPTDLSETPKSTLKRLVRLGVPMLLRPHVWFQTSGAAKLQATIGQGYFEKLVASAPRRLPELVLRDIEKDVPRTMTKNAYFARDESREKLRQMLRAFAVRCPHIGYCQGMNRIAGLLLLLYDKPEPAFYVMCRLIENYVPRRYYSGGLKDAQLDAAVLQELIRRRQPKVHAHLLKYGVQVPMMIWAWFTTVFVDLLPVESTMRVWDALFVEEEKVLFRVALAVFMMHKDLLLSVHGSELFPLVNNLGKISVDCNRLIDTAFDKLGDFRRSEIKKARRKLRPDVRAFDDSDSDEGDSDSDGI